MSTCASRWRRSARKVPARTAARMSTRAVVTTRASSSMRWREPTRRNPPLPSASASDACACASSRTSSSTSVPPAAAPAPRPTGHRGSLSARRSAPNSIDACRQVRGSDDRPPLRRKHVHQRSVGHTSTASDGCSKPALPLPVPASPVISTGACPGAARRTTESTACMGAYTELNSRAASMRPSRPVSRRLSAVSRRFSQARRTSTSISAMPIRLADVVAAPAASRRWPCRSCCCR